MKPQMNTDEHRFYLLYLYYPHPSAVSILFYKFFEINN